MKSDSRRSTIYFNHFGLSGDFSVVFYDRFGKKKRAMTAHSEHSNVPSMSGGYSQSSMTVRDHETQLKMAMEAYFRADDDGNFSTKKAKTLQIMDDAAALAEEEGDGVAGVLPALEEVTERVSRSQSGGGPMMEMSTMTETEAGAETERNVGVDLADKGKNRCDDDEGDYSTNSRSTEIVCRKE